MTETETRVLSIIARQLDRDLSEFTPEKSFVEDLGADSLDIVQFIMELETEFDLEIPEEEVRSIVTVQDTLEYIRKRLG